MRRYERTPADLILVVSLLYAAGVGLVCLLLLIAGIARADELEDYYRDAARQYAQLERQREAYEDRVEQGERQYDRMLEEQERQEQRMFRQEKRED